MASDELKLGGGSGGGDDGNNTVESAEGVYQIAANQLVLVTKAPEKPDTDTPHANDHVVTILAAGKLPASPSPRKNRAIPKPSAEAVKACPMEARLQKPMMRAKPMRQPIRSTMRPAANSPIA